MAVSRKEVLPESTIELQDIEMWIDTELNKSANQDILKKHGVLVLIDYNTKVGERYDRDMKLSTNTIYAKLATKYVENGWKFDYYSDYEYTLIKIR